MSKAKENISVNLDMFILSALDHYCYKNHRARSVVAELAIARFLAAEKSEDPDCWPNYTGQKIESQSRQIKK